MRRCNDNQNGEYQSYLRGRREARQDAIDNFYIGSILGFCFGALSMYGLFLSGVLT